MRRTGRALALIVAATALAACAGNPAPGEEGYPYNVSGEYRAEFVDSDGATYVGTMRLATSPGGAVDGEMRLEEPMAIAGTVEGTLLENVLRLSVAYEIPDAGCVGDATGSGTVAEGGATVEGELQITSDCDAPGTAAFRLAR